MPAIAAVVLGGDIGQRRPGSRKYLLAAHIGSDRRLAEGASVHQRHRDSRFAHATTDKIGLRPFGVERAQQIDGHRFGALCRSK
jgi:hypothetical protein